MGEKKDYKHQKSPARHEIRTLWSMAILFLLHRIMFALLIPRMRKGCCFRVNSPYPTNKWVKSAATYQQNKGNKDCVNHAGLHTQHSGV